MAEPSPATVYFFSSAGEQFPHIMWINVARPLGLRSGYRESTGKLTGVVQEIIGSITCKTKALRACRPPEYRCLVALLVALSIRGATKHMPPELPARIRRVYSVSFRWSKEAVVIAGLERERHGSWTVGRVMMYKLAAAGEGLIFC